MSTAVGEDARNDVAPAWSLRRVVTAAVIGNVLEWYDFAVYGFFAPILAAQFFPSGDRVVSLLAAFAAFAVGFLMRPVGAALFGYVGDRYGRARALFMSIAMMAIPTVLMGLLPTYATIGVAASFLIVLLRMFQGMAVGGEFTSSIVFLAENSPARRRGFFASFAMFGATSGTMLGSAVGGLLTRLLTPEQLASWGWRAAFVSGLAVAIVGIALRRNMLDSPARPPSISPLVLAFRHHRFEVLRVFALNMGTATTYYILFVYAATWVAEKTPVARAAALDITTSSILTFLVVLPIAAWVSDRVGRKLVMLCGMTGCAVLAYAARDCDARHERAHDRGRADGVLGAARDVDGADPGRDVRDVSSRSARERRERRLQPRVRAVRRHGARGLGLVDREDGQRRRVRLVHRRCHGRVDRGRTQHARPESCTAALEEAFEVLALV